MASKFSMVQTTTQLSAWSRITSSSYSFHPAIDRSTRIWPTGLASSPSAARRAKESSSGAIPVPLPPRMKLGLTMIGKPSCSAVAIASSRLWANPDGGTSRPISSMAALNRSRSSAVAMASGRAPITSTPLEGPALEQLHGEVEGGLAAQGGQEGVGSLALDDRGEDLEVEGLDVGPVGRRGSVMMVAGLEFTSTTR